MSEMNSSAVQRPLSDDEIDLQKLWGLLLDSRRLILAIAATVLLLGALYAALATPIYRADALLQIEKKQSGLPAFTELNQLMQQDSSAEGEIEILRSRRVLGQAVDHLGMAVQLRHDLPPIIGRFMAPGPAAQAGPLFAALVDASTDIRVTTFTVADDLPGKNFQLRAADDGQFSLWLDDTRLLSGAAGELLSSADGRVTLQLQHFALPKGEAVWLRRAPRLALINQLRGSLSVAERGRGTGIISITYSGPSPARNRAVLDAISEAYLLQNVQRQSAEAEKSLAFLEGQLPQVRADLEQAEARLNAFRLESGSVNLEVETEQVLQRLVALEAKESELNFQEKELSALYTREHPVFRTLIQQQQSVQAEKQQLVEQVRNLPETQQQVLRLARDVQVNQEIYVQMLNRTQELRVIRAGTVGNVRIIDQAASAPQPIKPRKSLILALTLVLGVMAGVAVVLVRAVFRQGIDSPMQIEETGLPVYAAIPRSAHQDRLSERIGASLASPGSVAASGALLAVAEPHDQAIEALRSLRTSLHFAMMDADNRVLMISGPGPEVGKSFVSANLAQVLSQINQRVLLIDGDMRKGHLHGYFAGHGEGGLSNYLSGQLPLEQVVCKNVLENLDFIARGDIPPNPAELLMHERFAALLTQLSASYDLVIIDSPPVLAVTDAAIIGQYAGTSLVVARFGLNTVAELTSCRQRFEQNGVHIKGAILNCMEKRASNSYGYYGYYQYSYKS